MENDLDQFYSEDSLETWKLILGEDLHYHNGYINPNNKEENPMEFCVRDLYPLINKKSKILDCGAGWGGPAKMFKSELCCDVTCLTISKTQASYLESLKFNTIHADFDFFIPKENYDYAVFFESLCHSKNQTQIFKNFFNKVHTLIIRDFFTKEKSGYQYPDFKMQVNSLNQTIRDLESTGYRCKVWSMTKSKPFLSTIDQWKDNLIKYKHLIKGQQLKNLYKYITYHKNSETHAEVYNSGRKIVPYLGTIYATK